MAYAYRTALITGASSGLGKEFAEQLAAQGTDLVLVARRAELLERLAADLRQRGVTVEVLAADLGDDKELARVEERLADRSRPIDLLVNNAGFDNTGLFAEISPQVQQNQIAVNTIAPMRLARAILPALIKEGRGGILMISSLVALLPMPGSALYGGTKAFLTAFSESLHMEAEPHGVHVTSVAAGLIRTEFHQVAGINTDSLPKAAWMVPADVAKAALAAVAEGKVTVVPGGMNKVQAVYVKVAPRAMLRAMTRRFLYRDDTKPAQA